MHTQEEQKHFAISGVHIIKLNKVIKQMYYENYKEQNEVQLKINYDN